MARREATRIAIGEFLHELGRRFNGRGTLYLAGGSAMVYPLTVSQIVAGFEEIAPRIEREALPRVREDDFRRKIDAMARLLTPTDTDS